MGLSFGVKQQVLSGGAALLLLLGRSLPLASPALAPLLSPALAPPPLSPASSPPSRSPTDGETRMFYEIVIAPGYTPEGLECLKGKSKNLRILEAKARAPSGLSLRQVGGRDQGLENRV